MIDYSDELKFNKQERDRIKAEINDLESRIVVESARGHRHEVINYRNRINRLKMRLNEVFLKIVDLEKKINNPESAGQIQLVPNNISNLPSIENGEITLTDTIEFDTGFGDVPGEVYQTVCRTIEKTIMYEDGKPVSSKEIITENITAKRSMDRNDVFIESKILK